MDLCPYFMLASLTYCIYKGGESSCIHYHLFFWDVMLGKDHGEISLMSFELGVMPFLEEDLVIVSLMFHGGLGACVDARVEGLGFEDSNPRMDM
jgi:hypothetical protein